jgi:hypothetical protein
VVLGLMVGVPALLGVGLSIGLLFYVFRE